MTISAGLALVLVASTALYMFVRWRHSPKALKAMIGVAISSLVAGLILGACIYRFTQHAAFIAPQPLTTASPFPTSGLPSFRYDATHAVLPNLNFTPGDILPGVTAADVCTPGWATDHRHVTESERERILSEYDVHEGWQDGRFVAYEVDHLIPLELGGSNDPKNLWPQPYSCVTKGLCGAGYDPRLGAGEKDQLENELHLLVCSGRMTLADAQKCIASNWAECWQKYMAPGFGTVSR